MEHTSFDPNRLRLGYQRNGLIDTAVKTSRSGYLQRCLIKHLEGLKVNYDMTVRDSDKSVIQFLYGEDGLDISKAQFLNLKQINFLLDNYKAIVDKEIIDELKNSTDLDDLKYHTKKLDNWIKENGNPLSKNHKSSFSLFTTAIEDKLHLNHPHKISESTGRCKSSKYAQELWSQANDQIKKSFEEQCAPCPMPLNSFFQPDIYYGSINERLSDLLKCCNLKKKERKEFSNVLKLKAMQSLCAPGEAVGLLAAQSIGEPSTQMTLNTFHFAGRGEMNVTLGIPRLREILMVASKNLKTPSMEIPFLHVPELERKSEKLRKLLTKVVVADVLEKIVVTSELDVSPVRQQKYTLRFQFLPHHLYKRNYHVKPKYVIRHMSKKFFAHMFRVIKKVGKVASTDIVVEDEKKGARRTFDHEDSDAESSNEPVDQRLNEEDSSDEEPEDVEDAKLTGKYNEVHDEQEPNEEEYVASDDNDEEEKDTDGAENPLEISQEESNVVNSHNYAQNYMHDKENFMWCQLTFALPIHFKKIDLTTILKDTASKSVLWEVPNINRAITYMKDDCLTLRTDGINMAEMFKYNHLLDLNKLYSNDIHQIAATYGIEAAQKAIVREVQEVFKVYGITVDPRHLLLIADYMTFNGTYEPLNRTGMENDPSPFHQMTFESSLQFLKSATIMGKRDQLENPSSCLLVGKPCNSGTGSFTLLHRLS